MIIYLIDKMYDRVQSGFRTISFSTLKFTGRKTTDKRAGLFAASPEAFDSRQNAALRKKEVPARCPQP